MMISEVRMLQAERNITNYSKLLQNAFLKIVYRYGSCAVQGCRVCRCVTELYSRAYDLRFNLKVARALQVVKAYPAEPSDAVLKSFVLFFYRYTFSNACHDD